MTQIAETIDRIPDNVLIHVIQHSNDFSWKFLALKIILTRLNLKLYLQCDESVLQQCCAELRNLLKKSINIPNAREDLKKLVSLSV